MADEITLQQLINQVKTELFSPYEGTEREGKSVYPIFFVDEVELEILVNISYDVQGGVKVSIPQVAEASLGAGREAGTAHKMTIKLSPILTRDELRELIDEKTRRGVEEASMLALRRGSKLAGQEE